MKKLFYLVVSCFCVLFAGDSFCDVLRQLDVSGNKRIQRETILAHARIDVGSEVSPSIVDMVIKRLYATGFFSNVSAELKPGKITIFVKENDMINRVAFEGNKSIKDEHIKILTKGKIEPRQVFRRAEVQEVMRGLLHMYRAKGHLAATITPKIIRRPESRVDVVFEINEGKPTTVKKILFVGNNAFSDSTLRSEMQTKESVWWKFWGYDDIYSLERVESDKRALKKFYNNNGFAAFQVRSHAAELSPDRTSFYLTFNVHEGDVYNIGNIDVKCEIKKIDIKPLLQKIAFKVGNKFKIDDIEKTKEIFIDEMGALGYAFVDVQYSINLDKANKTASVSFIIRKTSRVFIERIEIYGNSRTLDKVVRREFRLHEGDSLNVVKLRKSVQRIKDLDYFSEVEAQPEQGSTPDKAVIKVDVEEKSTGQFKISGGYSLGDGILGNVGISERNFFGTGKTADIDFMMANRLKSVSFGLMEPYFLDRDLVVGSRFGFYSSNRIRETSSQTNSFFISPYMGYQITEDLAHRLGYCISVENVKYKNQFTHITFDSLPAWQKESYGHHVNSSVSSRLVYSQVDGSLHPRDGYILELDNSFAGIGGNVHYNKHEFEARYYYPLGEKLTFWSKGMLGVMGGGRISDRFSFGGDSFRGFQFDGIGPRSKREDEDSVHGTRYYKASTGLKHPIGNYKDTGVQCIVFTEWGSLWRSKLPSSDVYDENKIRGNIGIGLEWLSPIGPISISFTQVVKKCRYDQVQTIQIGGLF